MGNILIKGVWYTEKDARDKGLLPKKQKKKSYVKKVEEKIEKK
jgi:hypothetical protein